MTTGLSAEVWATTSLEKELKIDSVPLLVITVIKYTEYKNISLLLFIKEERRGQSTDQKQYLISMFSVGPLQFGGS